METREGKGNIDTRKCSRAECDNKLRGKQKKFCSSDCYHKSRQERRPKLYCQYSECDNEIVNRGGKKYCSHSCSGKAMWESPGHRERVCGKREIRTCQYSGCDNELGPSRMFCSRSCKSTAQEERHRKNLPPKEKRYCQYSECDNEIGGRHERKYCSNSCSSKAIWKNNSTLIARQAARTKAMWENPEFRAKMSQLSKVRMDAMWENPEFRKMRSRVASEQPKLMGDKHPQWNGGSSLGPYPPAFNDDLKKLIRKRDEHKCMLCGLRQNGRAHDVHHIDYDKNNNATSNLITLCRPEHGKVHYDRSYWQCRLTEIVKCNMLMRQEGDGNQG